MSNSYKKLIICLLCILGLGLFLRSYGAQRPLVGYFDGGRIGLHVRYLFELPVSEHRFRNIDNPNPDSFQTYPSHPPFVVWASALFTLLIPSHELAIRLGCIIFSTFTTLLLFFIVKRHFSTRAAILSAIFSTVVPMASYYGGTAFVHDVASVFFGVALLMILASARFSLKSVLLATPVIVAGTFSDVHFNYLPFLAAFIYLAITRDRERFFFSLIASVITLAAFGLWLVYLHYAYGSFLTPFHAGLVRTHHAILLSPAFYKKIGMYFLHTLTSSALISMGVLVVVALYQFFWKKESLKGNEPAAILAIFLLFGLFPLVLFPAGAEMHIFWIYPLLPFFTVLFGSLLARLPIALTVPLVAIVFLQSGHEWVKMKETNDYQSYAIARYISENVNRNDMVLADENPNLLWYYLDCRIMNLNVFGGREEILTYANRKNVNLIATSGAYNLGDFPELLSTFSPVYASGGYRIFARRRWIIDHVKTASAQMLLTSDPASYSPLWIHCNQGRLGLEGLASTDFRAEFFGPEKLFRFRDDLNLSTRKDQTAGITIIPLKEGNPPVSVTARLKWLDLPAKEFDGAILAILQCGYEAKVSFLRDGILYGGPISTQRIDQATLGEWIQVTMQLDGEDACLKIGDNPPILFKAVKSQRAKGENIILFGDFCPKKGENMHVKVAFIGVARDVLSTSPNNGCRRGHFSLKMQSSKGSRLETNRAIPHFRSPGIMEILCDLSQYNRDELRGTSLELELTSSLGEQQHFTFPLEERLISTINGLRCLALIYPQTKSSGHHLLSVRLRRPDHPDILFANRVVWIEEQFRLFPKSFSTW